MRRQLVILAAAALLVTPAGLVLAQGGPGASDDRDRSPQGYDGADEDDGEADDESKDRERRERGSAPSDWQVENGTYTGEHIQVTVDEDLPGLRDVRYLDPNASVLASVELPGSNLTYHARGDVLAGETSAAEFSVQDRDGGRLHVEVGGNASASVAVADGVAVNRSERWSDDGGEAVYELDLGGNRTAWLATENATYANGTFAVRYEASLFPTFPPGEDEGEEDRGPPEDRGEPRTAGSQWDRTNDTFVGAHVRFELDDDRSGVNDHALLGSRIPVFASADLGTNDTGWEAHGRSFRLEADDARLRILDVPPALLGIEAGDNTTASLTLAEGVEATRIADDDNETGENETDEDGDAVYRLDLAGNRTGWLMGDELRLSNGTFTVGDRALFRAVPLDPDASGNRGPGSLPDEARGRQGGQGYEGRDEGERGPPEGAGPPEEAGPPDHPGAAALDHQARTQVTKAMAMGQVGAEVRFGEAGPGQPVAVETGPVQVTRSWAESNGSVSAGITVAAPDDVGGTTVTLALSEASLGNLTVAEAGEQLAVEFDNETIPVADDLQDVLDPEDDNGTAEYLLLVGGEKVQVLVSVPHFSPHTVEVYETQAGDVSSANGVPGFGTASLVAATGLAALAAAARRRD